MARMRREFLPSLRRSAVTTREHSILSDASCPPSRTSLRHSWLIRRRWPPERAVPPSAYPPAGASGRHGLRPWSPPVALGLGEILPGEVRLHDLTLRRKRCEKPAALLAPERVRAHQPEQVRAPLVSLIPPVRGPVGFVPQPIGGPAEVRVVEGRSDVPSGHGGRPRERPTGIILEREGPR